LRSPDWNYLPGLGTSSNMPVSSHRILKRRGRVVLVETGNPVMGIGYSVRIGSLGLWSGGDLAEAERQFEQATQ
jgi:hypothetical protein